MNRYIDAELFRKTIIKRFGCVPSLTDYSSNSINDIHLDDALNLIPTADVVEVVRCKDCEYWQDNNGGYPHDECRWGKNETPDADDYCSYGERREG